MAKLRANFACINNSCVTHSRLKNALQTPVKTEGSLLLPIKHVDNSNDQRILTNLFLPILKIPIISL